MRRCLTRTGRVAALDLPAEAWPLLEALVPPGARWVTSPSETLFELVAVEPGRDGSGWDGSGRDGSGRDGGWDVRHDGTLEGRVADLPLRTAELMSAVELWWAEHARGRVFVHAGVVAWQGRAIVLPARSMSGKSTLTAALLEAGCAYLSDEYAVLRPDGRVLPYLRPLSIRSPGVARGLRVPAASYGAGVVRRALPVGLVAHLSFVAGPSSFEAISPGRALLALLDNTVPARTRPRAVLNALGNVVDGALAVAGTRGEAPVAAAELLALL